MRLKAVITANPSPAPRRPRPSSLPRPKLFTARLIQLAGAARCENSPQFLILDSEIFRGIRPALSLSLSDLFGGDVLFIAVQWRFQSDLENSIVTPLRLHT